MRVVAVALILTLASAAAIATHVASTSAAPQMSAADYPLAGWQTATPQEVGMDPVKFAAAMDKMPSPSLVIRNGKIVGQKGDITRPGFIWSASKSLVALVYARLLQQGKISGYDAVVPNSAVPTSPSVTYRQFLTMTSDYGLTPRAPGTHYAYNNGAVVFYGQQMRVAFFQNKADVQMLQDAYVSALGFQDPLTYKGFMSGWDGGWSMSTRDMARIAYLILRNGNWNGQQILSASFINDLYRSQIPAGATPSTDVHDPYYNQADATAALPGAYSFGFWLPQQIQTEAITMSGAYGTTVHISRSKDLIVLAVNTTPTAHDGPKIPGSVLDMFAGSITGSAPTLPPVTGRIAVSADGNEHDCDDITSTAMSLSLLAKTGNASKLVYYGHSDHIWSTGLDGACAGGNREEEMRISSEETAKLWGGFNLGAFINAKAQTAAAVSALANQINASSASNPLWIIAAGPMEVIGKALEASDPAKRQYVTVISHSEWNDYHAELPGHGSWNFQELKYTLGANIQSIIDQNAGLELNESNYSWLQQSSDPKLNWIWQRHVKSGLSPEFDPSDSGMVYWLLTGGMNGGDQNATPAKLRSILEGPSSTPTPTPTPVAPVLLTEENSDRAIAFNAITFTRAPFALTTDQNFSSDKRTRLIIFAFNYASTNSAPTVQAENSVLGTVSLPVEHVANVPGFDWLTQIKVILPDTLPNTGDVWVRVVSSGISSNQARVTMAP